MFNHLFFVKALPDVFISLQILLTWMYFPSSPYMKFISMRSAMKLKVRSNFFFWNAVTYVWQSFSNILNIKKQDYRILELDKIIKMNSLNLLCKWGNWGSIKLCDKLQFAQWVKCSLKTRLQAPSRIRGPCSSYLPWDVPFWNQWLNIFVKLNGKFCQLRVLHSFVPSELSKCLMIMSGTIWSSHELTGVSLFLSSCSCVPCVPYHKREKNSP